MSDSDSERSTEPESDELETLSWYHGDLSRHKAEALLMSNGQKGSYLLRNCYDGPGCLALSVRADDSVKHFQVTRKDKCYAFGFQEFSSLREFVHHFANQPLVGNETGCLIVMEVPYPREVEEPRVYEPVLVHTAMHTGMTAKDLVASAPSLGTKEGYLVKQGAIFKSWKTRWFTLNRNELKYFKNKSSVEPIRTLDLRACSAVQADFSRKRINCFCKITRMVPLLVMKKSEHDKTSTKTLTIHEVISLYVQLSILKDKPVNTFVIVQDLKLPPLVFTKTGFVHTLLRSATSPDMPYSMVFPDRTFYMCAFTGIEAEEWIAMLSWKLVSDKLQF